MMHIRLISCCRSFPWRRRPETLKAIPVHRASLLAAALLAAPAAAANPLLTPSTLPYQAPRFDLIKDDDYQPAIEKGIAEHMAEIRAIADNPAPATFDNTIVAIERSGRLLDRATRTFKNILWADGNARLRDVQSAVALKLVEHQDAINLDPGLFVRIRSLWDRRATLGLDAEQAKLLDVYHAEMVNAGAMLSGADQAKLRALNKELSMLQTSFQQKVLAGTKENGFVVADRARLDGLSDADIAAAAQDAEARGLDGQYLFPLKNTLQQPALRSLKDRGTRLRLFELSRSRNARADANDTRATIARIAALRADKAKLLGYADYADYALYDQMAKTGAAAQAFIDRFRDPLAAAETRDAQEIQARIDQEHGGFKVTPADWDFYSDRVRKARYDLDDATLRPYFEIDKVLTDGVFYAANQLYGISFRERRDLPVYHPDVRVFEVIEEDGASLGLVYFDYWKRDSKRGGAWMNIFTPVSKLLGTKAVIYNVWNFTKPAPGQPALISYDDVSAMFHEFGHGLHELFGEGVYPKLAGINTAFDWLEIASQFNENWALDPKVLANYAVHHRTGAPMPAELIAKLKASQRFNQPYLIGERIAAMHLDLAWHRLPAGAAVRDADAFEARALAATGLRTDIVPPRYPSSFFSHIWSDSGAGYYAYAWTEALAHDAYAWFMQHGGLTRANGQHFRDTILSRGRARDYAAMYRDFAGRDPDVTPMLKFRGLISEE